jgi:adenosylcobinamide kinase / adenosylcobinamide-phosphate guanylyltransferase
MDVELAGTGGPAGWPRPGCRCASCSRARRDGAARAPAEVVLDGVLRIAFPVRAAGPPAARGTFLAEDVTGGLQITAPDGSRLLCAAGPGAVPQPPDEAAPYDIALLDLLGDPAQLGGLRRQGVVTDTTVVAVVHVDHRLPSERELARRCGFWQVIAAADGTHFTVHAGEPRDARRGRDVAPSLPRPWRALVLGGARSGKSAEAELRLAGEAEVTYVAAAGPAAADDADWTARVAAHQARRPRWWRTVETTDVAGVLRASTGAVLIDSIGGWLAAVLDEAGAWRHPLGDPQVTNRLAARITELATAWRQTRSYVVAVSEEAGSGIVPATASGRAFRDQLGSLNQLLAAQSEEAVLVVAGRALSLPG